MSIELSPCKNYQLAFEYLDGRRSGVSLNTLTFNNKKIENRFFEHKLLWDDQSRFLAIEEFQDGKTPFSTPSLVTLIDLKKQRSCSVAQVAGYIHFVKFDNLYLYFEKRTHSPFTGGYLHHVRLAEVLEKGEWISL